MKIRKSQIKSLVEEVIQEKIIDRSVKREVFDDIQKRVIIDGMTVKPMNITYTYDGSTYSTDRLIDLIKKSK